MGFANSSCSFTRFRILDPVENEILVQLPQLLKKFAFHDIDDLPEPQAYGWVCFDNMLDNEWLTAPPQKGQYAVFSLRLDTRRVPPGVIKKHLAIALETERAKMGPTAPKFISRERKKEIKEQVMLKLMQRFLPVPAEFNVIWNLEKNEVWFASIQNKMIDLFSEMFLNTFGLHLEPLTPCNLAESMLAENDFTRLETIEPTVFAPES